MKKIEKPTFKPLFHQKSTEERETLIRKYMSNEEVRCFFCGKMFFPGKLGPGTHIKPKCPRCKAINTITVL